MTLFDNHLGPFQKHSDTSRRAAIDNYPRSGTQRQRVLEMLLARWSGATDEEIGESLRLGLNSVRPRRIELVEGGWVRARRDEGRPVERATRSGSHAQVWEATHEARRYRA